MTEVSGWELVEAVYDCPTDEDHYVDGVSVVYVPKRGLGPTFTNLAELNSVHSSYYQIILRSEAGVDPRYLARYLNSPEGVSFRRAIASGSTIPRITDRAWQAGPFFLPCRQVQQATLDLSTSLQAIHSEITELESLLWSDPSRVGELKARLAQVFDSQDAYVRWIDTLPFPLASILWAAHASQAGSHRQVEYLEHFFEAVAEYTSTILISGLRQAPDLFDEERAKLRDLFAKFNLSVTRSSFGTWVRIAERLAKKTRTLLNDDASRSRVLEAFCLDSREPLLGLTSRGIASVLQQANKLRNSYRGHGGAKSDTQDAKQAGQLQQLVGDYRDGLQSSWSKWTLIIPGKASYSEKERYRCEVEQIVGPRTPFQRRNVTLQAPAVSDELHL